MLIDLHAHQPAAGCDADVCVVGAGAAGIPLTRRLVEFGRTVCLIEGGGFDFERETQELYSGENLAMTYYPLDEARLRFFGGTTNIWGGRCALLDPIDFERRDWVPHSGWPISRDELIPFYQDAHQSLELGEFNYEQKIWSALGLGAPPLDSTKINAKLWRFDEMNERFSASRCADLIQAKNATILLHANVTRLQASMNGRTIRHVLASSLNRNEIRVRAKHFVLACGAIENARLLLASNDIVSEGLGNRFDQVGRYFMEHPHGRLGRIYCETPFQLWAACQKRFTRNSPPLAPVLLLSEDTQRETGSLNNAVTLKLQRSPDRGVPLNKKLYLHLKHRLEPTRQGRAAHHTYRRARDWIHRNLRNPVERFRIQTGQSRLYLIVRAEQAPNPASRVKLSATKDSLGVPRADLEWRLSHQEKHSAATFARVFDGELRRLGLGRLDASNWLADPDPSWPVDETVSNHPIGGYHHMGTTRMSAQPANGVVDSNCKVHDLENLFIAGSSVFSTAGWANPTLTIVALSLRLAELLNSRLD